MGRATIAIIWIIAAYLVAHYSLLLLVGPSRLYSVLGGTWYNAIFPMGGFNLLLLLAMIVVVWGAPLVIASACGAAFFRMLWRDGALRLKLWLGFLAGVCLTASLPFVLFDGWPGRLWAIPFGDDTEFASGYSASGFWAVREGMTSEQVVALLGPPLKRYTMTQPLDEDTWDWTRSPRNSSYRMRGVVFRNDKVVRKYSEFYVD